MWLGRRPLSHYNTYILSRSNLLNSGIHSNGLSIAWKPRKRDHKVRLRENPWRGKNLPSEAECMLIYQIFLNYFFLTWCGPSRVLIPSLTSSAPEIKQRQRRSSALLPLHYFFDTQSPFASYWAYLLIWHFHFLFIYFFNWITYLLTTCQLNVIYDLIYLTVY